MAASSLGMKELPYAPLPFSLDGTNFNQEIISRIPDFSHEILLISGVRTDNEIMRGEEVQLLGCYDPSAENTSGVYIFPGTHSKHIRVKQHKAVSFKTYMTGELFQLLTEYSLLKNSVLRSENTNELAFRSGVQYVQDNNFLASLFSPRINDILMKMSKVDNFSFLSGLLIGYELNDLLNDDSNIYLCGHKNLSANYILALKELSLIKRTFVISPDTVDDAVVLGHLKMLKLYLTSEMTGANLQLDKKQ